jgi:hypothetical protein
VKQRAGADHFVLPGEGDAALANDLVEILDGLEVTIGERLVEERAKMGTLAADR